MEILEEKLVSVIIPTYSRPAFLKRAINSVLNQTYKNIEVIVVDDNNPDSEFRKCTEHLMAEFELNSKVVYIKHSKNKNGSAARNTGIDNSQGKYVAFLDDDDEFLEHKIEKQVILLDTLEESWGGVYCNYQTVVNSKVSDKYLNKEEGNLIESLLLCNNSICGGSTLLLRKSVLTQLKGFDITFKRNQDWELLVRFFRNFKLGLAPDILVNIHMDSRINTLVSKNAIIAKEKFLNAFENDIDLLSSTQEIYKRQWYTLGISLMASNENHYAFQSFKRGNSFRKFNIKDYLLIGINYINKYFPIKRIIKNFIS